MCRPTTRKHNSLFYSCRPSNPLRERSLGILSRLQKRVISSAVCLLLGHQICGGFPLCRPLARHLIANGAALAVRRIAHTCRARRNASWLYCILVHRGLMRYETSLSKELTSTILVSLKQSIKLHPLLSLVTVLCTDLNLVTLLGQFHDSKLPFFARSLQVDRHASPHRFDLLGYQRRSGTSCTPANWLAPTL